MVPDEAAAIKVGVVFPANDVAHGVVGAGVGGIHGWAIGLAALAVVGQRAVDPAAVRVDGQPFGPVHLGSAQEVTGLTRFDDHFGLIGKTVGRCERALGVDQGQPGATPVGVKTGHVEHAVVKQVAVVLRLRFAAACGGDAVAADKLVDVLKACVFAAVHHGAAVLGDADPSAFVRGAAQRRALDGGAGGVHRVHLNDPAKTVEFVGVFAGVKTFVVFGPAVPGAFAQAPAALVLADAVTTGKVAGPVFFA